MKVHVIVSTHGPLICMYTVPSGEASYNGGGGRAGQDDFFRQLVGRIIIMIISEVKAKCHRHRVDL
jgi:hypothetical protein